MLHKRGGQAVAVVLCLFVHAAIRVHSFVAPNPAAAAVAGLGPVGANSRRKGGAAGRWSSAAAAAGRGSSNRSGSGFRIGSNRVHNRRLRKGSSPIPDFLTVRKATPAPDVPVSPPSEPNKKMYFGESTKRSLVKALGWRVTAGIVTLISGLYFSGNLRTALTIVGSDFLSKAGFMFAGERLWNKVKWGQGNKGDSNQRSIVKALVWRIFAASNTLICSLLLAKDLGIASKIAGSDTIFKTGLFFFYERIWSAIEWGKEYEMEYML